MMPAVLFENLYQEEIYNIQPGPVVVLDKAWDQVANEEQSLLGKILSALKLDFPKVRVITRQECDPADLSAFNPSSIIFFGVKPASPEYQRYQRIDVGSTSAVYADSLDTLDEALKKRLWQILRGMFGV